MKEKVLRLADGDKLSVFRQLKDREIKMDRLKCALPFLITITALFASLATTASAKQKEWTLDLGHAHLGWEVDHMDLARTAGRFDAFDGTFLIDAEDPANSQITITVDASSVNSHHVGRDNHVRSIDYLNADGFPSRGSV